MLAVGLLIAIPASAQTAELTLRLHRDFGFGAGNQMQGAFTATATGPQDLAQVDFLVDGRVVHTATQSPYSYSFNTGEYPLGAHTLLASGVTTAGARLNSAPIQVEFVTPEVGWQTAGRIALPLVGALVVVALLGTLAPMLIGRKSGTFQPGVYGVEGGAVCPRCGLPFSRHFLSLNLPTGKLERCPHCGRWVFARRASPEALRRAEARLQTDSSRGQLAETTETDRLQQSIDDSRFEDG